MDRESLLIIYSLIAVKFFIIYFFICIFKYYESNLY